MKRYLFSLLSLLLLIPLSLSSCQDEDFGYSQEEIFRDAYERNFIKAFGEIDPEETWDFSKYGNRHGGESTRAGEADPGWYRVDQFLLDDFFPNTLTEGVNHSMTGENFCILTGHEDFTLVPLYKSSVAATWSLHMVMFLPDGTKKDKEIWSNSTTNVMKIQTTGCTYCEGKGFVSASSDSKGDQIVCPSCNGGWIAVAHCNTCNDARTLNGGDCPDCKPCDLCVGAGVTHDDICSSCGGKGGSTCTTCSGLGYVMTGKGNGNGKKTFSTCNACKVAGQQPFSVQLKNKEFRANLKNGVYNGKLGTGQITCSTCHGDGKGDRPCSACSGIKYFTKCTVCGGTNQMYKCTHCGGTGVSDGNWMSITETGNQNHTTGAVAIEGYPVSAETILGEQIPTDGIVYFYITAGSTTKTSMENGMRLFTPQVMNTSTEAVKIIACDTDTDNDYNDFVLMIKGSPTAIRTEKDKQFTSIVEKRYMAEDFGSNADWDFNDVVVDVFRSTVHKLTGSGTSISRTIDSKTTTSSIKYLCGTLPLQVTVGGVSFAKITDPLDEDQTIAQLSGDPIEDHNIHSSPGWEVTGVIPLSTPNWNPDQNNISLTVWKKDNTSMSKEEIWQTGFPTQGGVPYIIATDITDSWTLETQDIRNMEWFRNIFMGGVSWP